VAPKLVLYGPAQAPYTEKCRRGLILKGLDFELHEPGCPEDFKRWNPETGLLPVLTIDAERIIDSTQILLHIDALAPKPPLLSADPTVAEQQRHLENWADESFLYYFQRWTALEQGRASEAPTRRPSSRLLRLAAWLRAGGTWERPHTAILRSIDSRLADLVNFLGSRRFFYADAPSIADLAVYGILFTLRNDAIPGASPLLTRRPALVAFMARVEEVSGG
jgi:glutathione S-transferase